MLGCGTPMPELFTRWVVQQKVVILKRRMASREGPWTVKPDAGRFPGVVKYKGASRRGVKQSSGLGGGHKQSQRQ